MQIIFDSLDHFEILVFTIDELLTILQRARLTAATWDDYHKQYSPVAPSELRRQWHALAALDTDSKDHLNERRAWTTHYIVDEQNIAATICPCWHYRDRSFSHIYWYLNLGLNYRYGSGPLPQLANHLIQTVKEMSA